MLKIKKIAPRIGAQIEGIDFTEPLSNSVYETIYETLIDNLVIFIRNCEITPAAHLAFAQNFGKLDDPHIHYPHVNGFENIMLLENDADNPPDTNSWHTDMTYKQEPPFASVLVARSVPECGGDTLWSSCYAAYERLPDGMKNYLQELEAIHDYGDFRNSYAKADPGKDSSQLLNETIAKFGQSVKPIIDQHPVSGQKYLNFNVAFVAHIVGMTTSESDSLKNYIANHMNKPEDQMRWRWKVGDLAMWDNRVTMHYALADYYPQYRCMNRVTVIQDRRSIH